MSHPTGLCSDRKDREGPAESLPLTMWETLKIFATTHSYISNSSPLKTRTHEPPHRYTHEHVYTHICTCITHRHTLVSHMLAYTFVHTQTHTAARLLEREESE